MSSYDQAEAITRVLYRKAALFPRSGYTWSQWLHSVIATTVADTIMIVEGDLSVEDYE